MSSEKTVKLLRTWTWPNLLIQTPGTSGIWDDLRFTENREAVSDYTLVLNNLAEGQTLTEPVNQVFRLIQEPPVEFFKPWHQSQPYAAVTLTCDPQRRGPNYRTSHPMVPWHINRDFDFLQKAPIPVKERPISWITSTKAILSGHKMRMDFLEALRGKIPGFDLLGTRIHHMTNPAAREKNTREQAELGFEIVTDKWAGLAPYRYALAIENFSGPDYWTEKIADCYLAWTLPIYHGCTNLEHYFPPRSFIRIDIERPQEAIRTILDTLQEDPWSDRLEAIREARELVLHRHQLFPAITRFLHEQEDAKPRAHRPTPSISVVVCTYNRADILPRCLESLAEQTLPGDQFEVLIIDSLSTDRTAETARTFCEHHPRFHYFLASAPGLSHARNLGIREAGADYIAFIDDDSFAAPDWLAQAVTIIGEKKPDIFGGEVQHLFSGTRPAWFKDEYTHRGDMGASGFIKQGFIIGTNIFFKKELLLEYGGFDPLLGMQPNRLGYHEETRLVWRAFQEERPVYFAKELQVYDVLPDYKESILYYIYAKYRAGIDGLGIWQPEYGPDHLPHYFSLVKRAFDELNNALLNRDRAIHPYPENHLLQKSVINLFTEIGMMTEFFLKNPAQGDKPDEPAP